MRILTIGVLLFAAGCSGQNPLSNDQVTLYRNSFLSQELRVHWATFNASDGLDYNLGNCQMAARLLNANVIASAEAEGKAPNPNVGFWCEVGSYSEDGGAPIKFDAEYPTDTTSPIRFTQ